MGTDNTYYTFNGQSVVNRNLETINIRNINKMLTELFQRYSVSLNEISEGQIIKKDQVKKTQDLNRITYAYNKGRVVVANGIDHLKYLIDHRDDVAKAIGVDSNYIHDNRRNIGVTYQCIQKMNGKYEIGEEGQQMQIFISKEDDNTQRLNSQHHWIDYILSQSWIDGLAQRALESSGQNITVTVDYRHDYLADKINRIMREHELSLHSGIENFNEIDYFDDPNGFSNLRESRYIDAVNRLLSMNRLQYMFYSIHKPIGGSREKYIDLKVYTNGEIDISGVVGLEDCQHVEWEYGSREYLRSLNTGNQRYDFKLSIPFNDANSIMWWKPDNPERLDVGEEQDEGSITEPTGYRYYKPYETERFLRWFGTNFVPMIDLTQVSRQTVCQSPTLANDVSQINYFSDATNIATMNMSRANLVPTSSQSLLNVQPRATMKVINKVDPPGQYAMFVVNGNQQTTTLSFRVTGKMLNVVQEMNHYPQTWGWLRNTTIGLGKNIMALELENTIYPNVSRIWSRMFPDDKWIPDQWIEIQNILKSIQRPTTIDLLRLRQIDFELIVSRLMEQFDKRYTFLKCMNADKVLDYVVEMTGSLQMAEDIEREIQSSNYLLEDLFRYIQGFGDESEKNIDQYLSKINLSENQKENLLIAPLKELMWIDLDEEQRELTSQYQISYEDVTVDDLRESIQTFNNLIVRLPTNTYRNNMVSRHIFQDWKEYVDRSIDSLAERGLLFFHTTPKKDISGNIIYSGQTTDDGFAIPKLDKVYYDGIGTDGKTHKYVEYYIDDKFSTPLVDYSYIKVEKDEKTGKDRANFDRWDYWSEDDFA